MAVLPTQPPFPPAPLRKQQLSDDVFEDAQQLTKAEAAELRAVVRALYDDDALEDFLDEHCDEFECYAGRDGEQQLGWTPLHTAYVALMEERIEAALEQTPLQSSDSLFALLRRVQGTDERASAFILRLLSIGDYAHFCDTMADRQREVLSLKQFEDNALKLQLEMSRLDFQLGMD
mmetsp:Transcript_66610/g.199016  ORF Transcript_66610/g.199016 Transcript_66610/m.199016 type:complete len:176 (-) Transcript_66610:162-689(-)